MYTVHVDWDPENTAASADLMVAFMYHIQGALKLRFKTNRIRIKVYHDPLFKQHNLHRWHSFGPATKGKKGKPRTIKDRLHDMGCTIVDIAGHAKQQADQCITKHMRELREDLAEVAENHVYVLVSSDGGFMPHLEAMYKAGFQVFAISSFDCLSHNFTETEWLEIWSFFTIARGDTCKVRGVPVERGYHPKHQTLNPLEVQVWANPFDSLDVEEEDPESLDDYKDFPALEEEKGKRCNRPLKAHEEVQVKYLSVTGEEMKLLCKPQETFHLGHKKGQRQRRRRQ